MRKLIFGNKIQNVILLLIIFSFFISVLHCNEGTDSVECTSCSCSNCKKQSTSSKTTNRFNFINNIINLQLPESTGYTILFSKDIEHPPKFA